jgi:hypothetical protein
VLVVLIFDHKILTNFNFVPSNVLFLVIVVNTRAIGALIYLLFEFSHLVMLFSFATLHPNAGAQLRAEISLLPSNLHNMLGVLMYELTMMLILLTT